MTFADEIAAYLERAERSLEAARQLALNGHYDFAASRAYIVAADEFLKTAKNLLAEGQK